MKQGATVVCPGWVTTRAARLPVRLLAGAALSGRLAGARRVFVPNADVASRLARYFPDRELTMRPHPESLPTLGSLASPLASERTDWSCVIRHLVAVKALCGSPPDQHARYRGLPLEFHVIGSTDRDALSLGCETFRSRGDITSARSTICWPVGGHTWPSCPRCGPSRSCTRSRSRWRRAFSRLF